jgi:hypothetical protein
MCPFSVTLQRVEHLRPRFYNGGIGEFRPERFSAVS